MSSTNQSPVYHASPFATPSLKKIDTVTGEVTHLATGSFVWTWTSSRDGRQLYYARNRCGCVSSGARRARKPFQELNLTGVIEIVRSCAFDPGSERERTAPRLALKFGRPEQGDGLTKVAMKALQERKIASPEHLGARGFAYEPIASLQRECPPLCAAQPPPDCILPIGSVNGDFLDVVAVPSRPPRSRGCVQAPKRTAKVCAVPRSSVVGAVQQVQQQLDFGGELRSSHGASMWLFQIRNSRNIQAPILDRPPALCLKVPPRSDRSGSACAAPQIGANRMLQILLAPNRNLHADYDVSIIPGDWLEARVRIQVLPMKRARITDQQRRESQIEPYAKCSFQTGKAQPLHRE